MTVRHNPITGEPALFSTIRAERQHAFTTGDSTVAPDQCPFCPGNEHQTPPEIARLEQPDADGWTMRVFPNKYPSAAGAEVIVEAREHDARFEELPDPSAAVRLYVSRYLAHPQSAFVSIFKNEGALAGASIPHLHSQVIPLPFLPPRIEAELAGFSRAGACPLCAVPGQVIDETTHFVWIAPHASRMPWQQWLIPKTHKPSLSALSETEVAELGGLLSAASAATRKVASSYNWAFMNFGARDAHFYVDLCPRATIIGGLELGTGTFVEIIDPADAAPRLRPDASTPRR